MKKAIVFLMVAIIAASSCFAALIQIGPTARYNGEYTDDIDQYKDLSNYEFGADARVNLGMFGVAANALFSQVDDENIFNTIMTANLRLDMSLIELSVGAGFDLPIVWNKTTGSVVFIEKDGTRSDVSNFMDVVKNSDLLVRAAVGVNLGGLGVSVDYRLPFSTVKSYLDDESADTVETFKKGRAAISMLINLF